MGMVWAFVVETLNCDFCVSVHKKMPTDPWLARFDEAFMSCKRSGTYEGHCFMKLLFASTVWVALAWARKLSGISV